MKSILYGLTVALLLCWVDAACAGSARTELWPLSWTSLDQRLTSYLSRRVLVFRVTGMEGNDIRFDAHGKPLGWSRQKVGRDLKAMLFTDMAFRATHWVIRGEAVGVKRRNRTKGYVRHPHKLELVTCTVMLDDLEGDLTFAKALGILSGIFLTREELAQIVKPIALASSTAVRETNASGRLELIVLDASTGRQLTARVRLRDALGRDHVPTGEREERRRHGKLLVTAGTVEPLEIDRWFISNGSVSVKVPAGKMLIRVERGLEYRPALETVELREGEVTTHQIELQRWINLRERGYVCGENHIHQTAGILGPKLAAEGLDFGTSMSWWNSHRLEVPTGFGWKAELSFAGTSIPTSVLDAELEYSSWGPVYLIGLKKHPLFQADQGRSALSLLREAHEQGALVCYHAGWRPEALLDSLLGHVDVINVCNNYFLRHMFLPRKGAGNLLSIEGLPEYANTPLDMMRMNTDGYYRLLNCGLRLAVGAGSSSGAQDSPVGYNRAYVRAGGEPDLEAFLQAWREGRNFVTNGPMIFFTARDISGRPAIYRPGDTIGFEKQGGRLRLKATVHSDPPLRSLEIVVNGQVIQGGLLKGNQRQTQIESTLEVDAGMWLGVRATAEDRLLSDERLARYRRKIDDQLPCRLRFAHTSPIYVSVGGQGAWIQESVEEARRWLDGFELLARSKANPQHLPEIVEALAAARAKLNDPR